MSEVATKIKNVFASSQSANSNSSSTARTNANTANTPINAPMNLSASTVTSALFSFALCALCCTSLCQTIECGFYISDALRNSFLLNLIICICAQFILHIEVFSPKRKVFSRGIYASLSLCFLIISIVFANTLNPVQDVPENYFVCTCVFAIVNAVVFALSKRKVTRYILLVSGCFTCAYIQLLYEFNMTLDVVLFLISCFLLMSCNERKNSSENSGEHQSKNESKNLSEYQSGHQSKNPTAAKTHVYTILYAICICALGALLSVGIIQLFNPGAVTVELTTEYMAYPEDLVRSAASSTENPDTKDKSNNIDEDNSKTTTDKQIDDEANVQDGSSAQGHSNQDEDNSQNEDSSSGGSTQGVQALALNTAFPWYVILIVILLVLFFALYVLTYLIRRRRLTKIQKLEPNSQIEALYNFFISRFEKLGIVRGDTVSEIDFANFARVRLEPYVSSQAPGTFDHLSAIYIEQKYGGEQASKEDLEAMYYLYWKFYENVRLRAGWFKFRIRYIAL